MIPHVDKNVCTGCGDCAEVCPPGALIVTDDKVSLEEEFCEECGFCVAACPVGAITIPFPTRDRLS